MSMPPTSPATIAPGQEALSPPPAHLISAQVAVALSEDLGGGDVSAALVDADTHLHARLITREDGILCGRAWFDETMRQLDADTQVHWRSRDGDAITADQTLCEIQGRARAILSAERTAMNFLQTLSGTATQARHYARIVAGTGVRLLDTRKTLPGLRLAQKYATRCGGFVNHRVGLYDQYLIKENHIHAAGSISAAIHGARREHPELLIEVEVENLEQLEEACVAGAPCLWRSCRSAPRTCWRRRSASPNLRAPWRGRFGRPPPAGSASAGSPEEGSAGAGAASS